MLKSLKSQELTYCYVTDSEKKLLGYVTAEKLESAPACDTVSAHIENAEHMINRNAFLFEALTMLKESDLDVPVTDKKNKLRGIISHADIVEAMA